MKTFIAALLLCITPTLTSAQKPNILVFYADDFGYTDTGYNGSDFYETPNLDQLRKESLSFTNAYAACANCAPSRASLLTGLYTSRHKIYTVANSDRGPAKKRKLIPIKNTNNLATSFTTLPQTLKDAGYATAAAGKWHVSKNPSKHGIEHNIGGNHTGTPRGGYFSPYKNPQLPDGPKGEHLPDRLANDLNTWINQQADTKKPFFAYMSFYSVHTPIQAREDLTKKYQNKTPGKFHNNPKYAAMVEAMDLAIGKIINNLKQQGLEQNTIIVFTSDNGPHGAYSIAKPLRGTKGMFYEGGIREPFLIKFPNLTKPNSTSHTPIHQVDIFPTLANAAGAKLPDTLDGIDLRPLIEKNTPPQRDLFWHFPCYLEAYRDEGKDVVHTPGWRATPCSVIRSGDFKLIQYFEDNSTELFNLKNDPSESNNLSKSNPEKTKELLTKLTEWQKSTNADIPTTPNPKYQKP